MIKGWARSKDWLKITTIDAHTEGEPFRVITGGFPDLQGETILARRRYAKEHFDHLRRTLMWEPRGHADMYGCIVTPPISSNADLGVVFMHNDGYSTMCGHGIIGITTVALEVGMLPKKTPETIVTIDTPAGLVTAHAKISNSRVKSVYFHNVPSFVVALNQEIEVPGIGDIRYDLAFGGAFYAYVNVEDVDLTCTPKDFHALIEKGMRIKHAVAANRPIIHPFEDDLSFLYGTIFIDSPLTKNAHSRNVCIFANGQVDRCPTGTGVSGRLAIHYAKGEVKRNQPIVVESLIGSQFKGQIIKTTTFGPYSAIIPEIEGSAHIIGCHEFFIDPSDPLRDGFLLH